MSKKRVALVTENVDVGVEKEGRVKMAEGLSKFLSDSYLLYLKTQNFHWNVTGKEFASLHVLFENQYKDLASAIDEIAERIRALGHPAPGSFEAFFNLATIDEANDVPPADEMIRRLMKDNETASHIAREMAGVAEDVSDEVTNDLLVERMQVHDKNAWMLRSLLA